MYIALYSKSICSFPDRDHLEATLCTTSIYTNTAEPHCVPLTCIVHHCPVLCTMLHKGGHFLLEGGVTMVTPQHFPGGVHSEQDQ